MIKKLYRTLVVAAAAVALTACDDFFDLRPSNEMVLDDFWQSEDDVLSVTGACYRGMQESDFLKRLIVWGEFRSDNLIAGTNNNDTHLRNIANLNLLPSNDLSKWNNYYNVINLCNTVEHYAPQVCQVDPNFTTSKLNAYLAEVKGIRAYCYFTLVRAFRDVPFTVTPTIDDTEEFNVPQSDPDEVLDYLIDDLIKAEPGAAATYGNTTYNKGRMTQAAIRTLIADMCLWRGRYEDCVEYCNRVLTDSQNQFAMENSMSYSRNLFVNGLSNETIFELQFNTTNYSNYAVADYYGLHSLGYSEQMNPFDFATNGKQLFDENDLRGRTSCYIYEGQTPQVRKYTSYLTSVELMASAFNSSSYYNVNPYESNWIVYRLPEVYLMKAEALAELNTDLQEAFSLACISYDRAHPSLGTGSVDFSAYNNSESLLNFIYDERQREFIFEGKRYFDILRRITHHRENFKVYVDNYLVPKYADLDQSTVKSKLSAYDALFMPINSTEMRANMLLVQNPFYKTSTDISN